MELEPGKDDIDSRPGQLMSSGRIRMKWHVCLPSGRIAEHMTQTSKVSPSIRRGSRAWDRHMAALKAKAHRKAEELIRADEDATAKAEGKRKWRYDDRAADYIGEYLHEDNGHGNGRLLRDEDGVPLHTGVATAGLEADNSLRESSKQRYRHYIAALHDSVGDMTLGELCCVKDYRALEDMFKRAERRHGSSSVKHLRVILNSYVYHQLKLDGLVRGNPVAELGFKSSGVNRGTSRRAEAKRAGRVGKDEVLAATPEERARCVRWLLADPCEAKSGRRGGLTKEQSAYHRRAVVEMTLLQATCALRLQECVTLTAGNVSFVAGRVVVHVTEESSKTGGERDVACIDAEFGDAVSERMRKRVENLEARAPVFASCKDNSRFWDKKNAENSARRLYDEMADACDVPVARIALTHLWRATLNGEYAVKAAEGTCRLTEQQRAELFGHTTEVNRKSYTRDLSAADQLRLGAGITVRGDGDRARE